jgi:hypothetical protein
MAPATAGAVFFRSRPSAASPLPDRAQEGQLKAPRREIRCGAFSIRGGNGNDFAGNVVAAAQDAEPAEVTSPRRWHRIGQRLSSAAD